MSTSLGLSVAKEVRDDQCSADTNCLHRGLFRESHYGGGICGLWSKKH